MITPIIAKMGRAEQVFDYIRLIAQQEPNTTLGEILKRQMSYLTLEELMEELSGRDN